MKEERIIGKPDRVCHLSRVDGLLDNLAYLVLDCFPVLPRTHHMPAPRLLPDYYQVGRAEAVVKSGAGPVKQAKLIVKSARQPAIRSQTSDS